MLLTDFSQDFDLNSLFVLAILSQPKYLGTIADGSIDTGSLNIKLIFSSAPDGENWMNDDLYAAAYYGYRQALKSAMEDSARSMLLAIEAAKEYYHDLTNNNDQQDPAVIADVAMFKSLLTFARATNNYIPLLIEIGAVDGTAASYPPEYQTMLTTGD